MAWYFILWIVLGIIIVLGSAAVAGYHAAELGEEPALVVLSVMLVVAFFPVLLVGVVISAPFIGLYYLGKHLRNKKA